MQTIKTEHGIYKIKDDRDVADFMAQLRKPKARKRPPKMEPRIYPKFWPGETSTRTYLREYYEANKFSLTYLDEYLKPGPSFDPAPCWSVSEPLCEVSYE